MNIIGISYMETIIYWVNLWSVAIKKKLRSRFQRSIYNKRQRHIKSVYTTYCYTKILLIFESNG